MDVDETAIGRLVQYSYEGLRVGTIRAVTPKMVEIEPIGGKQRTRKKHLTIPKEDVILLVEEKRK